MKTRHQRRAIKSETIRCRVDQATRFRLQEAAERELLDESDVIRRALALYLAKEPALLPR